MNENRSQFTMQEWETFFSVLYHFNRYCESARTTFYGYSSNYARLHELLSNYRTAPPDDWGHRFIDIQVKNSLRAATSAEDKQLHNFIVLEYITDTKRSRYAICNALHISRTAYEEARKRALDRLCVLVCGFGGVEWWEPGNTVPQF